MVGKSVGKGKIERGVQDSKRFVLLVPMLALIVSVLIFTLRAQLIGIFNLNNNITQVTLDAAMTIMAIYAFEFTVRQMPYILIVGVFRSGGDTVTGVKFDLFCLWCLSLPATLISVYLLKLPFTVAFAVMYIFEDYAKTILCLRYYKSMKWIKPVTAEGKNGLKEYFRQKDVKNGAQ